MLEPFYAEGPVTLYEGDCIEVMRGLPDESVDSVVTDPPYGLEFMGKEWDGADGFRRSLNAADAGRENVFGRTSKTSPEYRTRPVVLGQISDGDRSKGPLPSGPGSNSRGYADHDKHAFQAWCEVWAREALRVLKPGGFMLAFGGTRTWHRLAVAVEDSGFEIRESIAWLYGQGFPKHTSVLKPAFEPVVVGRKALAGTIASNVVMYGVGALNIEANRIPGEFKSGWSDAPGKKSVGGILNISEEMRDAKPDNLAGRWPTNVLLDESQANVLDAQSGVTRSRVGKPRGAAAGKGWGMTATGAEYDDLGGASRFFYVAKADGSERPDVGGVQHPTVKPLALMQWLVRLVTPPGGVVLEPFAGSGTTAEACVREGFSCIAIEREPSYLPLIIQRLDKPHEQSLF